MWTRWAGTGNGWTPKPAVAPPSARCIPRLSAAGRPANTRPIAAGPPTGGRAGRDRPKNAIVFESLLEEFRMKNLTLLGLASLVLAGATTAYAQGAPAAPAAAP